MPFKINIATKEGKTYKLEAEALSLEGKELNNIVQGKEISPDLEGYEFEITGASDKSGFTAMKQVPGIGLKKLLLSYEKGMKKRPKKEGKRKRSKNKPKGLRLRKTVRGKVISPAISQINLKITKTGERKLSEIFPGQNKAETTPKPVEKPKTEELAKIEETKKEEMPTKETKPEEKPE